MHGFIRNIAIAVTLLLAVASHGQQRNFSPWFSSVTNDKPLLGYVEPIIASGAGDHISLFVHPEDFNKNEWDAFIQSCHEGGISTVYKCVDGSEKSFDTPEARKLTVDKWIEVAKKYSFDGIDMDIENLSPEIKQDHSIFVKYASERMHKEGLKLAMAVGFYPPMVVEPLIWWYDPAIFRLYCDNIRVMLYDQNWGGGKMNPQLNDRLDCWGMGPTCSYPYARKALEFWMKHVPTEKLTINVPAYNNVYYMDPQYNEGVMDAYTRNVGQQYYPRPQDMDESKPVHRYWSWMDRIWVYIYTSTADGRLRKFYASDEESTSHLLDLFEEKGITSVGMWFYRGNHMDKQWEEVNQLILDWSTSK